jgi:ribosomal protein S27AE
VTTTANCPSCGGPIEFAIGSSIVVVCAYCRSVVARNDRGLENLGQVAAIIDTGSPLRTLLAGKFRGIGFRITGRTQMQHEAGGLWDEWYAAFDDGRWGWLAEAQGRYYVTFATKASAPDYDTLIPGDPVEQVGNLIVNEIGEATIASAEGEIPWRVEPQESYRYADLTGTDGRFATIDYSEDPPLLFAGHEATLTQLGLESLEAPRKTISVTRINCPNCGGALDLQMAEKSERIFCPNCGSAQDVERNGTLRLISEAQKKRVKPAIPIGSTGTIDGVKYVVAGFMQRSVTFDQTYFWLEYLLFNREAGFRWLVQSDDHWSFVKNIPAGEVSQRGGRSVGWNGKTFKLFQDAMATVTYVAGEFYWRVEVGEAVATADYIAPPEGLSKEGTANEVNYSHAVYMRPEEVEGAFGVKHLPRPQMVGPLQPYTGPRILMAYALFVALLVILAVLNAVRQPDRIVYTRMLYLADAPVVEGAPENTRTYFSEPFRLDGKHNVVVEASCGMANSWAWIGGELVNESSGLTESFDIPMEYYQGVESGESWHEGNQQGRVYLSAPPAGTYSVRLEAQWEKATTPGITIKVREGVFHLAHFLIAFVLLTLLALVGVIRQLSFEAARWKESAYSP